jgi:hypothetical protein
VSLFVMADHHRCHRLVPTKDDHRRRYSTDNKTIPLMTARSGLRWGSCAAQPCQLGRHPSDLIANNERGTVRHIDRILVAIDLAVKLFHRTNTVL